MRFLHLFKYLTSPTLFSSKKEDWNAIVRKGTVHRNPIGSAVEAQERQRNRQSLRRRIMETTADGMTMNTEQLLEFNPKLADVSVTTRIAYAKFMTTKLKKEIKFEDEKIEIENEKMRVRGTRAFNKFKANAGILKKSNETSSNEAKSNKVSIQAEPTPSTSQEGKGTSKDFRSRTPIEEDPNEGIQTPDRCLTPENILDEPVPETEVPNSTPSPETSVATSPPVAENRKADSPMVKMKSASSSDASDKSPDPPTINTPDPVKEAEDEESEEDEEPPKKEFPGAPTLNVPSPSFRPSSPSSIGTGDKGKSKITGKTLTGWI